MVEVMNKGGKSLSLMDSGFTSGSSTKFSQMWVPLVVGDVFLNFPKAMFKFSENFNPTLTWIIV